jgi:hypothetical protein
MNDAGKPTKSPCRLKWRTVPARGDADYFTLEAKSRNLLVEAFTPQGSPADPNSLDRINGDDKGNETVQESLPRRHRREPAPNVFETLNDDPTFQFVVPPDGNIAFPSVTATTNLARRSNGLPFSNSQRIT